MQRNWKARWNGTIVTKKKKNNIPNWLMKDQKYEELYIC